MKNPSEIQDEDPLKRKKMDESDSHSEQGNEILKDFHDQQKKYAEVKATRRGKGI